MDRKEVEEKLKEVYDSGSPQLVLVGIEDGDVYIQKASRDDESEDLVKMLGLAMITDEKLFKLVKRAVSEVQESKDLLNIITENQDARN